MKCQAEALARALFVLLDTCKVGFVVLIVLFGYYGFAALSLTHLPRYRSQLQRFSSFGHTFYLARALG